MFIQKKGGSSKTNYAFSTRDKKRFIGDAKFVKVKPEDKVTEPEVQKVDKKVKKSVNNKEAKDKEE